MPQSWLEVGVADIEAAPRLLEQAGYRLLVRLQQEPLGANGNTPPKSRGYAHGHYSCAIFAKIIVTYEEYIMFLIDTQSKKAVSLERKTFSALNLSERNDLQEWITGNPNILGENLLIIQKEFDGFLNTNERLDLLALDERGKLVIIENKLDDSGKDVVWQALKYVSYCATLTEGKICDIYQQYLGNNGIAAEKIAEFYDEQDIRLNPANNGQRIILVAANFRKEVTSTVLWLYNYGIDITCIKVTPYKDNDKLYLDVERILPIQDIGDYQIRVAEKIRDDINTGKVELARHKLRRRFWDEAIPILRNKTGIFANISSSKDSWIAGSTGYSGITFNPIIKMKCARAELYIDTGDRERNKNIFYNLQENTAKIESIFGSTLDWQELPDKKASKICVHFDEYGLTDEEHWNEIIEFLADNLAKLVTAFKVPLETVMKG